MLVEKTSMLPSIFTSCPTISSDIPENLSLDDDVGLWENQSFIPSRRKL